MTDRVDISTPSRSRSPLKASWWITIFAVEIVMCVLFWYFGIFEYALPVLYTCCAVGLSIAMNWVFHSKAWFWIALSIFAVVHIPLVIWLTRSIPSRSNIEGRGLAGFALADAAIFTAAIRMPGWIRDVYAPYTGPEDKEKEGQ